MATLTFKYVIFDYVFPLVFPELFDHRQSVGFGTPKSVKVPFPVAVAPEITVTGSVVRLGTR